MDLDIMIAFGIGMFLGAFLGVFLAALVMAVGKDRRGDE